MRLLHLDDSGKLTSTDFSGKNVPPYAILSHTWGADEFLFENLVNNTGKSKTGYDKILFCHEQTARDHLQYFWVDTCCIDKWNLRELSNAINSMFEWYKNASKCYVFLADVSINPQLPQSTWEAPFRKSRWFTRGWTLQELIAPTSVEFYSLERHRLGDKETLEQQIHEITSIPIEILQGDPLQTFSIQDRKSWMLGRETTQEEDMAYSLIGIFEVSMEFRYGEGKDRALKRLEEEIEKVTTAPFVVPFDRNVGFVGRELQLAELKGILGRPSTTKVAIAAPSGTGKTQLALELAYRIRQENKDCSVFWIPASDLESLYQAYTQVAQQLNIPGWKDENADVKKLVQLHLSKESTAQWLLIFDNVEDVMIGTSQSSKGINLTEYLPNSKQGSIVFTTSNKNTAIELASQNVVQLPVREQDIAQKLLEINLKNPMIEHGEAKLLVQELGYLPLAIAQAAAYINLNKMAVKDYLSLLAEQKDGKRVGKEFDKGRQHHSVEELVATTWLISFKQIQSRNVLAVDYLFFMACIDQKDISLALLPEAAPQEQKHALETLDDYLMITRRQANLALDIHRLVHLAISDWLLGQGLLDQWAEKAITRLLKVFPDHKHGNRNKWRRLLPHANYALSSTLTREDNKARIDLIWKCAMTLHMDGRFNEAEVFFHEAMEKMKKVLGKEHPDTLASMANLALTYKNQGHWKKAEELQTEELKICSEVFGQEHDSTLASMANLASIYLFQGRWKEAEDLDKQVTETRERALGQEHPDTLISMANLATTFWNQGRWKEAEDLEVQVMQMSLKALGQEHPSTLTSMANLASTYRDQKRWKEAEDLEVQVMETSSRVLGQEHPSTLAIMANLASTYKNQRRWKEAENLEIQVVERSLRILGPEHPDTLISLNNLSVTYSCQGRYKEAEEMCSQVIEARKKVLGEKHPSTLASIANLVSMYKNQKRGKEAEDLEAQIVEMRK